MWGVLKSATQEFTTQLASDLSNKNTTSGSGDDPFLQQEEKPKVAVADAKKLNIAPVPVIASGSTPPLKVGLKEQLAAASSKDEEDGGWDDDDWGQLLSDPPSAPADALPPAVPAPVALPNVAPALTVVSQAVSSADATVKGIAGEEEDFWGADDEWGQSVPAPACAVRPEGSTPAVAEAPVVSAPLESPAKAASSLVQIGQHLPAPNATSQDAETDPWGNDDAWGSLLEDQPTQHNKAAELDSQEQPSDQSVDSGPHASDLPSTQGGGDVSLTFREQHIPKGDAEELGDGTSNDVVEGLSQLAPGIAEQPVDKSPIDVEQDSAIPLGGDGADRSATRIASLATPLVQAGTSKLEVQKLTKLLEEASCNLSSLQEDFREINEKYASLEAKHKEVQAQHEAGTAAHMATQQAIESLRAQFGDASSERDAALCQVGVTRTENAALADKLSSANAEIERLRRQAERSTTETDAEHAELQRELAAARGEVEEVNRSRGAEESDLSVKLQSSEAECAKLQAEAQTLRDACAQLKLEGQSRLSATAGSKEAGTCPSDGLSARDAPHGELLFDSQGEQAYAEPSPAWAASLCTDVQDVVRQESERSRQTMSAELVVLRDALTQMHAELRRVAPQSPGAVVDSCGQVDLL